MKLKLPLIFLMDFLKIYLTNTYCSRVALCDTTQEKQNKKKKHTQTKECCSTEDFKTRCGRSSGVNAAMEEEDSKGTYGQ